MSASTLSETLASRVPGEVPPQAEYWIEAELEITACGPSGTLRSRISRPYALIGSSSNCDMVLAADLTSDKAIYLHATRQGVFFVDMTPSDPDGEICGDWLGPDPVAVGEYQVSANLVSSGPLESSSRPDLLAAGRLLGPRPVIELADDDDRKAKIQISRGLTILGRSRPSALRIKSRLVSTIHAALFVDQDRLWVIDLGSLNGVRLRGQRVRVACLQPGETITLGGPTLKLDRFAAAVGIKQPAEQSPVLFVGESADEAADEDFAELEMLMPPQADAFPDTAELPEDDLIDPSLGRLMLREKTRRKRRLFFLAAVAVTAALALGSTGFWAWGHYASHNRGADHEVESIPQDLPLPSDVE